MKPRHPIACIDATPTPEARRLAEERRLYATRLAAFLVLAFGLLVALLVATYRR